MKKIVISLLVALFTPMMLQAGGIGIYIPYSLGIEKDGTIYSDYYSDSDYTYKLKNKSGLGLALASNLGKDSVFGYKFALEYTNPQDENSNESSDKIAMLHTFEFGVVNTKVVRFWLGPRINVGYEWFEYGSYERSGIEIGIAPAVGINVNLGSKVAVTFDIDYKFAWQGGSITSTYYDSFSEGITGPTARLGLFFKFGESYQ